MRQLLLLFAISFCLSNCKKDTSNPKPPPLSSPTISSISPETGGYKTVCTIAGTNFVNGLTANEVKVNGKTATVQSVTPTSITILVPTLAGTGPVTVTNANGTVAGRTFTYVPDVYIGGGDDHKAVYWKNGIATILDNRGYVNSMAVQGDDIYAAGNTDLGGFYWKNDVPTELTTPGLSYGSILSIVPTGGDLYAAGTAIELSSGNNIGIYWKNGVMTTLDNGGSSNASYSMALLGSDIYVASNTWNGLGNYAKLWKNAMEVPISNSGGEILGAAFGVYAIGADMYVVGGEGLSPNIVAKYWKNGNAVALTDGTLNSICSGICVSGSDLYVCGAEGSVGKYWKNGVAVVLTDGTNPAQIKSIQVLGDDVYCVGTEYINSFDIATYWKNGVKTQLTTGGKYSSATSIVLR